MSESDGVDTTTLVLLGLGAIVVVPLLMTAVGFGGMMGYGMMSGYGGTGRMGGWWPLVGMLVPLILAVLLLVVGYFLVRRSAEGPPRRDGAVEELRLAYARGDLTDEEFERRRERLERSE